MAEIGAPVTSFTRAGNDGRRDGLLTFSPDHGITGHGGELDPSGDG
jgi:hypothetical protein